MSSTAITLPNNCKFDLHQLGYQVLKVLGQGSWGTVVKARKRNEQESVAVKIIERTLLSSSDRVNIEREAEAMLELNHTNIVKLHTVHKTDSYFYFVMEYCPGGDLLSYVQEREGLNEQEARTLFSSLASAVSYAHNNNYVHRDIKLENCFMTKKASVRLGDWGFSRKVNSESKMTEYCGSIHYSSPEIVRGTPYNGPEVDVWSLGVTLYAMSSGLLPFYGPHEAIVYSIKTGTYKMQPSFSENLKDLLEGMLETRPEFRFTMEEVLAHPWILEGRKQKVVPSLSANSWSKVFNSAPLPSMAIPSPRNHLTSANTMGPRVIRETANTTQQKKTIITKDTRQTSSGVLKAKDGRKSEKLQAFFKSMLRKKHEKETAQMLMPSPRFKNTVQY